MNKASERLWAWARDGVTSGALCWQLLMVACTIKFSTAWVWIGGTETAVGVIVGANDLPLLYEFQTVLWLGLIMALGLHLYQTGLSGMGHALAALGSMFVIGLLASALGIAPFESYRLLGLWAVCVVAGALLGDRMPGTSGLTGFLWCALGILVLSLLFVAFGVTDSVLTEDMDEQGWRGLFYHKNGLGWISSILFTVALAVVSAKRWLLPGAIAVLAMVCILGSASRTSLVVSLGVVPYILLFRFVMDKVSTGLAVFLQLSYLLFLGFVGQVLMPILLEMLGKDATFTGRTEIWALYFKTMMETPWLGEGPGAFTGISRITDQLLWQLNHLGHIYTPHNMYLGALGDAGLLGLINLCGVLIYLSFMAPLKYSKVWASASAAVGFLVMTAGFAETHEIYAPGLGWFLLVFFRAAALREQREASGVTQPSTEEGPCGFEVQA